MRSLKSISGDFGRVQTKVGMNLFANQSGGFNESEWGYGNMHVSEAWEIMYQHKKEFESEI